MPATLNQHGAGDGGPQKTGSIGAKAGTSARQGLFQNQNNFAENDPPRILPDIIAAEIIVNPRAILTHLRKQRACLDRAVRALEEFEKLREGSQKQVLESPAPTPNPKVVPLRRNEAPLRSACDEAANVRQPRRW